MGPTKKTTPKAKAATTRWSTRRTSAESEASAGQIGRRRGPGGDAATGGEHESDRKAHRDAHHEARRRRRAGQTATWCSATRWRSKSPFIHAQFAAQTGQALVYEHRLAPVDGFEAAVRAFVAEGGRGASVTVPFKLDAHALADTLSPRAAAAGAVNTLRIDADGRIFGDNTDGVGLVRDIESNLGVSLAGARILLLGAGGAARRRAAAARARAAVDHDRQSHREQGRGAGRAVRAGRARRGLRAVGQRRTSCAPNRTT
jgi:hypothetical protein